MSAEDRASALLEVVFGELSEEARSRIGSAAEPIEVEPGGRIAAEGDVADAMYVVASGTVQLSIHERQSELAVATVGDGEILGWSWMVPPHRWTFDAASTGGAALLRVPAEDLRTLMADDPEAGTALASTMVSVVSRRLRDTRIQLLDLFARGSERGR